MTLEQIVLQEIAQGRVRMKNILESRPMIMRADLRFLLRRLKAKGLISCEYGGRYRVIE